MSELKVGDTCSLDSQGRITVRDWNHSAYGTIMRINADGTVDVHPTPHHDSSAINRMRLSPMIPDLEDPEAVEAWLRT